MRSKLLRVALCIVLCTAVAIFATQAVLKTVSCNRLVKTVGLEHMSVLRRMKYASFRDPLQYVDGYEIAVFSVPAAQWKTPESWTQEESSLEELVVGLPACLNTSVISKMELGEIECSAWVFVDGRENKPFDEQEFHFACFDVREDNTVLVLIYRGHHLYGI